MARGRTQCVGCDAVSTQSAAAAAHPPALPVAAAGPIQELQSGIRTLVWMTGGLVLIGAYFAVRGLAAPAPSSKDTWEYRVANYDDYSWSGGGKPDRDGLDGWEIISARRAGSTGLMGYECILRRRR